MYSVMLGAGLLAKRAVEMGLKVAPYIKTSLRYWQEQGLPHHTPLQIFTFLALAVEW